MRSRSPDRPALVAGLVLIVLGGVLLGDAVGAFTLTLEALGPVAFAAIGAVLVALGLSRGD